ncbi:hypothetical protein GCM10010423_64710 [Streptomyces levis]|uniref:Uncharacterized protein n=1 Tax=Streptomyces levis TaxID=285566 RepID=A0ABN3P6I0_9ACTN
MICIPCREAADSAEVHTAETYNQKKSMTYVTLRIPHPKGCGCDCQHRKPTVESVLARGRAAHV